MKYLIIGGVAGGATAAARLRRLDESAEIILFEKGEYISYANCGLPYYLGGVIDNRKSLLVQTEASFSQRFNINVRSHAEVVSIDSSNKKVEVVDLKSGIRYQESFDKLLLSPGARPFVPLAAGLELPGVFTVRDVKDSDRIKTYLKEQQARTAVVIGGGFIGLEIAENFKHLGLNVSLIERQSQVLAPLDASMAAQVHQHLIEKGINLYLKNTITEIVPTTNSLICYTDRGEKIATDIVILALGVKPETQLAKDSGIHIGQAGGIVVNEYLETSVADIYAVGDAIEFVHPVSKKSATLALAGPANKQARIAANNMVRGNLYKYKGAVGVSVIKLFDLTIAFAGLSSATLARLGIVSQSSITYGMSHAGYYPNAKPMTIRSIFAPDGKLLGAQIIGYDGVDKRMEMMAAVLGREGTVDDLTTLEHAYAPPFSSAKDPVNIAGFVAQNILSDGLEVMACEEMVPECIRESLLIDVRTAAEFMEGSIEGAINCPLDNLRMHLSSFSKQMKIIVFCQQGMRGYLAQRILLGHGFDNVINLSGGYQYWHTYQQDEKRKNKNMPQTCE